MELLLSELHKQPVDAGLVQHRPVQVLHRLELERHKLEQEPRKQERDAVVSELWELWELLGLLL